MNMKKSIVFGLTLLCVRLASQDAFKDIPVELNGIPEEQIIKLDSRYLTVSGKGKIVTDLESTTTKCGAWTAEEKNTYKGFIGGGLYDMSSKKVCAYNRLADIQQDGKYHWYKIGTASLGKKTILYLTDWTVSMRLDKFYKENANNTYDVWISVKAIGIDYVKCSTAKSQLFLDRSLLIDKSK